MQLLLVQIDRLPEKERTAVTARISPADVVTIQNAAPLDWIPMRISADLAHAVTEALGPERARAFFREQFGVTLSGTVLSSLVGAVERYISSDPRPALRWLSRGHDLLFRGVGRLVLSTEGKGSEAVLSLVDLPPELAGDRVWLDRYAASVASLRIVVHTNLECEVIEARPEERYARFRVWWTVSRPPRR